MLPSRPGSALAVCVGACLLGCASCSSGLPFREAPASQAAGEDVAEPGGEFRCAVPDAARGLFLAGRNEDRDLAVGLLLVVGIGRVGGDGAIPPAAALVAAELANLGLKWLWAVLDGD